VAEQLDAEMGPNEEHLQPARWSKRKAALAVLLLPCCHWPLGAYGGKLVDSPVWFEISRGLS